MPLCGFDKQMLDGLDMFHRGLADSIIRKSKEVGITLEESIHQELDEMNEFIKELQKLPNRVDKQKLIGLANYAQSFYEGSLQRSRKDSIEINEAMDLEIKTTRNFLYEVDRCYEEDLKGKVPDPIKKLVEQISYYKK